jgi:hypothetical protein
MIRALGRTSICYNLATGPYSPYLQNCLPLAVQYPFENFVRELIGMHRSVGGKLGQHLYCDCNCAGNENYELEH